MVLQIVVFPICIARTGGMGDVEIVVSSPSDGCDGVDIPILTLHLG